MANILTANEITHEEILNTNNWYKILHSKTKKSAPGADGLTYEYLKALNNDVAKKIIYEMNKMYDKGTLIDSLKITHIKPILKPNKPADNPSSYRLISLLPTLTKVINAAVLHRINHHITTHNIIPDSSFGYKTGSSTISCLTYVTNYIMEDKRNNNLTAIVFFDFKMAYNTVVTSKLINTLRELHFPPDTVRWINNYLNNRETKIETMEGPADMIICNGLPQGCNMAPTLFNVMTKKFHEIKIIGKVELVQYADDMALIISGKTKEEVQTNMKIATDKFTAIAEELNLIVNAEKTKILSLSRSKFIYNIQLNQMPIENVKVYCYLGVMMDKNLTFSYHINTLKKRVCERINMLKIINGLKFGSHPEMLLRVYNALVTSLIMYGATIYGKSAKNLSKLLETTHRQALRVATGCTKTTPINTLSAISAVEPLFLKREFIAKKEISKHLITNNIVSKQLKNLHITDLTAKNLTFIEETYLKYQQEFQLIATTHKNYNATTANIIDIHHKIPGFTQAKNDIPTITAKNRTLEHINNSYNEHIQLYTDASKTSHGCSIGIYDSVTKRTISTKLRNNCSIMTAELTAILIATEYATFYNYKKYIILTDSQSGCRYLNRCINNKITDEISFKIISAPNSPTIQWIPSHVGVYGNEKADELATLAFSKNEYHENKILITDAINNFKQQKLAKFNSWYREESTQKGKKFYEIYPTIGKHPWFHKQPYNRIDLRVLNRLLSGHDFSNYWLGTMKINPTPLCDTCNVNETSEHSILYCTKFINIRLKYNFNKFNNLNELMKDFNKNTFENILKFLKEANINI